MAQSTLRNSMQQVKDTHFSLDSDENAIMKEIQAIHAPDGREFAVKPLLYLIEAIFQRTPGFDQGTQAQLDALDDRAFESYFLDKFDHFSFAINKISSEIHCKFSGGEGEHATTLGILNILKSYAWDEKVVLALGAFAFNYGEFWVLAKLDLLLKQLPGSPERIDTLKPKFKALSKLIEATLEVTKCVVEFKELPSYYNISPGRPEVVTATSHIPTAVYWTIRSIVTCAACASEMMNHVGMGYENISSITEPLKLSSLAQKFSSIHIHLSTQLTSCHQLIQGQTIHAPDGRELAVKPLLYLVEAIFQRAPGFDQAQLDALDDGDLESYFLDMFDQLSSAINRISSEIYCKFSSGEDERATTLGILNILKSYAWDAKVVLALGAFAFNYGEFWVLAKLVPLLKSALKPKFKALSKLIGATLDVTKCVVEFKELPSLYNISPDTPELVTASSHIPTAVYWTTRSIVACAACASQILSDVGMGYENISSTTEPLKLSSLAQKLNHLKTQLTSCHQLIQGQTIHAPDGREFAVKPLLYLIEAIFQRAPGFDQAQLDALDDRAFESFFLDKFDHFSFAISKISSEIHCKFSGGEDELVTTLGILNILKRYVWDEKVVLALGAFAFNYGEFWVLAKLDPLLKQLPDSPERVDTLKPKFEALSNLIKVTLDVTKCVVEFKELPSHYNISPDTPELVIAASHIPIAVDWTIRSIVACAACASEMMNHVGMGYENISSTIERLNLSSLAQKFSSILIDLKAQLTSCHQLIQGQREFAVKPLLSRIEAIFQRAPGFDQGTQAQLDALDDRAFESFFPDKFDHFSFAINKISSEVHCKFSAGEDEHVTTLGILNILKSYAWDAKVVLALGAFAFNYGEFWVLAELDPLLKQLPDSPERVDTLKPKFEVLSKLIKATLDVTKCVVEFKELPSHYLISPDTPEVVTATSHIPTAVYWTTRSIVACAACASQMLGHVGMGYENLSTTTELSSLARKISSIDIHFKKLHKDLQGQTIHEPDGREFAVKPLLDIIENMFQLSTPDVPGFGLGTQTQLHVLDDKYFRSGFIDIVDHLSKTINDISFEISCKFPGGKDAQATTLRILNILRSYAWDGKLVLALAAFAFNYRQLWVLAQPYSTNPLAKSVPLLKQLPETPKHVDALKPKLQGLSNLIKAMLDVNKCIVEFTELPSQYIGPDRPEMVTAISYFPTAVYWSIRGIMACASQIMGLVGIGYENISSTTNALELSSLGQKVSDIHNHLKKLLTQCHQIIEEEKHNEAYERLKKLMGTQHNDNMEVLTTLIYAKDGQLPLLHCATKTRATMEVLKGEIVLLLISDLDVSSDYLLVAKQIYNESREQPSSENSRYDMVWVPVVERSTPWTHSKQDQFENLQSTMPWHSVYHPSMIDPAVIKYINEVWQFKKKPILVVLDTYGKVVNNNAIHMILIWRNSAFPFTRDREQALWQKESWSIELLAGSVDPVIPIWTEENKYICLYGGEDIEWIRKFTGTSKAAARATNTPVEMLYVGKSKSEEIVLRNMSIITAEKLSHALQDSVAVWLFWERLERMLHSRKQFGSSEGNDAVTRMISKMLSFDRKNQEWAMIGRWSYFFNGNDTTTLPIIGNFDIWTPQMKEINFQSWQESPISRN